MKSENGLQRNLETWNIQLKGHEIEIITDKREMIKMEREKLQDNNIHLKAMKIEQTKPIQYFIEATESVEVNQRCKIKIKNKVVCRFVSSFAATNESPRRF